MLSILLAAASLMVGLMNMTLTFLLVMPRLEKLHPRRDPDA